MSLFNYLFDSEWRQRDDIDSLRRAKFQSNRAINRGRKKVRQLQEHIDRLEGEIDELALFSQTLLRVLEKKNVCPEHEFLTMMARVDAEDGVVDGRAGARRPKGE